MNTGNEPAFIVLKNGAIRLHLDKDNFQCEGTPTNEAFRKSWDAYNDLNRKQIQKRNSIDTLDVDKARKKNFI